MCLWKDNCQIVVVLLGLLDLLTQDPSEGFPTNAVYACWLWCNASTVECEHRRINCGLSGAGVLLNVGVSTDQESAPAARSFALNTLLWCPLLVHLCSIQAALAPQLVGQTRLVGWFLCRGRW